MVCPNCGKEISASRFCPECGIELNGSSYVETYEKRPKKPIFKRWWFWVIVFVILLASIGSKIGEDSQHSIDHNEDDNTQQIAPHTREVAIANDGIIYTSIKMSDSYFSILKNSISDLESGTSLLETYETCEDMMRVLSGFRDRLKEVNDSAVENYVDKADSYISNLWLIAKDISDYIDDGKMSDLSDAKEGIVLIPTYQTRVLDARSEYLLASGLTQDEADSLLTEYIDEN